MYLRRCCLVMLCVALVIAFGGCILDSDEGCDACHVIAGCIQDMAGGPMAGVKVRAFFDPMEGVDPVPDCSTYTNSNGCYRIPFPPTALEIFVYPVADSCVFSPYGRNYDEPEGAIHAQDYVGYCGETYSITGHVRDDEGHDLAGIYITLKDSDGFWRDDTVTDALGAYVLGGMAPNVAYVVKPSNYCSYTPSYRAYDGISVNLLDQDFTRTDCAFHTVRGYVRDAQDNPLAGIALETWCFCHTGIVGGSHTVYTDANGHYSLDILTDPDCVCYVEPRSEACDFLPSLRAYSGLAEDLTDENYTAYCGGGHQ